MLQRLGKFHNKQKERIKSTKKIYSLDNGLLQIAPKNSKNLGTSLENLVFNALNSTSNELNYLKDNYEIDFVTENHLIQVSYNIENDKTRKRELNAFKHFKKKSETNCQLITYDTNEKLGDIDIISIDKLLIALNKSMGSE